MAESKNTGKKPGRPKKTPAVEETKEEVVFFDVPEEQTVNTTEKAEPTEENVRRIVKDCSSPIYEVNYINFSSSISREMMTLFAQLCVENNCSQRINRVCLHSSSHHQVYDCYVGGIALEPYLFTFQRHHVYSLISSPHSDPAQVCISPLLFSRSSESSGWKFRRNSSLS